MLSVEAERKEKVSVVTDLRDEFINECTEFIGRCSNASFFHHPLWLKILTMETLQPYCYIVCRDNNNEIEGIMPLLKTKGLPFNAFGVLSKKRISSLPRTPFAGPLANNRQVCTKLIKKGIEIQKGDPGSLLQIKTNCRIQCDNANFRVMEWRKAFIKEVPGKNEPLKFEDHRNEKNILKNVRNAEKSGVKFRQAEDPADLLEWYKLYLIRMRFHKVPARSFLFFKYCWELLKSAGMMDLNLAVQENGGKEEVLGGSINFKYNNICYGAFNAGNMEKSGLMFGDFLMFSQLLMLQENGYTHFDLGEVPAGHSRLEKYKKNGVWSRCRCTTAITVKRPKKLKVLTSLRGTNSRLNFGEKYHSR
jgi:hypothetical protein